MSVAERRSTDGRGADNVARELIRASVANIFAERLGQVDMRRVIEWFDLGGSLHTSDTSSAKELLAQARGVQGLVELTEHLHLGPKASEAALASAVDFVLEGLYAQKKITRSDEFQYQAGEQQRRPPRPTPAESIDRDLQMPGKKKYYN